ncbi:hypothetical protein PCS_03130 [Desulfocurvibacter africanus PCS]|uniref:Uncharacterized protein n=1 Tax=Desulfocurvibacter africanus PCS TaxID=1262666 RepID=M5PQ12_DESAF|nr:hypothetical protein [Desulfocurvibacter africanus]EMG36114.1 hypothetical protein PCS_03130 [Desulfocurvibacter africanus PCS]
MKLRYDDLARVAAEVRAEMAEQGKTPTGIRKKPRDPEKAALLKQMVLDKAAKYPWELVGERRLRLPYFYLKSASGD